MTSSGVSGMDCSGHHVPTLRWKKLRGDVDAEPPPKIVRPAELRHEKVRFLCSLSCRHVERV